MRILLIMSVRKSTVCHDSPCSMNDVSPIYPNTSESSTQFNDFTLKNDFNNDEVLEDILNNDEVLEENNHMALDIEHILNVANLNFIQDLPTINQEEIQNDFSYMCGDNLFNDEDIAIIRKDKFKKLNDLEDIDLLPNDIKRGTKFGKLKLMYCFIKLERLMIKKDTVKIVNGNIQSCDLLDTQEKRYCLRSSFKI